MSTVKSLSSKIADTTAHKRWAFEDTAGTGGKHSPLGAVFGNGKKVKRMEAASVWRPVLEANNRRKKDGLTETFAEPRLNFTEQQDQDRLKRLVLELKAGSLTPAHSEERAQGLQAITQSNFPYSNRFADEDQTSKRRTTIPDLHRQILEGFFVAHLIVPAHNVHSVATTRKNIEFSLN